MNEALIILLILAFIIAYLLLNHWVAMRAQRKGRSYNAFLLIAVVINPVVALVILEFLGDNSANEGDLVRTLQKTKLDDGTMMPRKYASKVLAVKIIDQTAVVQLDGPTGTVWVARENVQKI